MVFICAYTNLYALETAENETILNNQILEYVLQLDTRNLLKGDAYVVINSDNGFKDAYKVSNEGYIVSANQDGDRISYSVAIPLKLDNSGNLINSFKYASSLNKNTSNTKDYIYNNLVDVIVYTNSQYSHYASSYGYNFYRPISVSAYWVPDSSSNISMSNAYVKFGIFGDGIPYPNCLNYSYDELKENVTCVDCSYTCWITNMPLSNIVYSDNSTLQSNRAYWCHNFYNHGGQVFIGVQYTINGSSKEYTNSHIVFYGA